MPYHWSKSRAVILCFSGVVLCGVVWPFQKEKAKNHETAVSDVLHPGISGHPSSTRTRQVFFSTYCARCAAELRLLCADVASKRYWATYIYIYMREC